jgi:hypothetical protein
VVAAAKQLNDMLAEEAGDLVNPPRAYGSVSTRSVR